MVSPSTTDVTVASWVGPVGPNVGDGLGGVVGLGAVDAGGGVLEARAALCDAMGDGPGVRFEIAPRPRNTATPTATYRSRERGFGGVLCLGGVRYPRVTAPGSTAWSGTV
jgi:hypothetical protein